MSQKFNLLIGEEPGTPDEEIYPKWVTTGVPIICVVLFIATLILSCFIRVKGDRDERDPRDRKRREVIDYLSPWDDGARPIDRGLYRSSNEIRKMTPYDIYGGPEERHWRHPMWIYYDPRLPSDNESADDGFEDATVQLQLQITPPGRPVKLLAPERKMHQLDKSVRTSSNPSSFPSLSSLRRTKHDGSGCSKCKPLNEQSYERDAAEVLLDSSKTRSNDEVRLNITPEDEQRERLATRPKKKLRIKLPEQELEMKQPHSLKKDDTPEPEDKIDKAARCRLDPEMTL